VVQRSEQANRVLDLAREEAERAGQRYLGPEHVLLGLLAEVAGLAVDLGRLQEAVAAELRRSPR
jgi:ATP-dependent Clp protease ATP-binding subunit ClpC